MKCVVCRRTDLSHPQTSKTKSIWRLPTFYPCRTRLRRTTVYWRQEYHRASKGIEQGICVPSAYLLLLWQWAAQFRIDTRSQRSSISVSLQRFASRRGLPATLNSDNAKTFKSSCNDIRKITRAEEVWRFLTSKRIMWTLDISKFSLEARLREHKQRK